MDVQMPKEVQVRHKHFDAVWVDKRYMPVLRRIKEEGKELKNGLNSHGAIIEHMLITQFEDYFKCNGGEDCGLPENDGACLCYVD